MTISAANMKRVKSLCQETCALIATVQEEMRQDAERMGLREIHSACGSRASGELRRRSMDLTRALADLRR